MLSINYKGIENVDITKITILSIDGWDLKKVTSKQLLEFTELEALYIDTPSKTCIIPDAIFANNKIKIFSISMHNNVNDIPKWINKLINLEDLSLSYSGVQYFNFLQINSLCKLKSINLNNIREVDLSWIDNFMKLKQLRITNSNIVYLNHKTYSIQNLNMTIPLFNLFNCTWITDDWLWDYLKMWDENCTFEKWKITYELCAYNNDISYLIKKIRTTFITGDLNTLINNKIKFDLVDAINSLNWRIFPNFKKNILRFIQEFKKTINIVNNTNVFIAGKLKLDIKRLTFQLAEYDINIKRKYDETIDYIVLGTKPWKYISEISNNIDKVILEWDIIKFLDNKWEFHLKANTDIDLLIIKEMIYSENIESIELLSEFLLSWWVPNEIKEDLIFVYLKMWSDGSSYNDGRDWDSIDKIRLILKNILTFGWSEKLRLNLQEVKLTLYWNFDPSSAFRVKEMINKLVEWTELNKEKLLIMLMNLLIIERKNRQINW